ncbi:lambda-exonuclease family protein [Dyadobacter sp. LHD-138]|uniref:YqaJ viral recombinase family nuclease n=1 Tax=Dyadobacter sp. LHD-138 TaxID=3071413 RepID=UPI0027E039A3|nr:YqaJ viral recombinase family protein [Dyadobacter sp. LHD-138]MDQ6477835.1 YqaJ viral recombinase family protein [Dyadobacter sp. LHD-138]
MSSTFTAIAKPIKLSPKSREEWLSLRQGIGSSEIATILALNKWETPYQLWLRKTGQTPPKTESFAMKAGHYLEDAVSLFWQDESGRQVIKSSSAENIYVHPEKDFLRVSPDRTYWIPGMTKNDDNKGILECKTTQMPVDGDDLPMYWFAQVQYQMGVMQKEQGSIAWLQGGREFGYKDVALVPDFYEYLVEEAEKFWFVNVQGRVEPDMISSEDVLLKYAKHFDGKIVEAPESLVFELSRLKDVKEQIKELDAKKDEIEEYTKLFMMDAEALMYSGQSLATWKAAKDSQKFDTKAFEKKHPELYSQFLVNTAGSRRFLLK